MFVTKDRVENRGFAFWNDPLRNPRAGVGLQSTEIIQRNQGVASGEVAQSRAAGRLGNGLLVETLHRLHWRLTEFFNVQLPLVFLIQPVEFGRHKLHELFLGDLAFSVLVHQGQQLLHLRLSLCNIVLGF
jgi:hypothetical protein